jgi:hypothetical protein
MFVPFAFGVRLFYRISNSLLTPVSAQGFAAGLDFPFDPIHRYL